MLKKFQTRVLHFVAILTFILCSLQTSTSWGDQVTYSLIGEVTSIYDPFGHVGNLASLGDSVSLNLSYETSTPDLYPGDPTRGTYVNSGSVSLTVNGMTFASPTGNQVDILDGFQGQETLSSMAIRTSTIWPNQLPVFDYTRILMYVGQSSPPFTLFDNDSLPTTIDFSQADILRGDVVSATESQTMYNIQYSLVAVPTPSAALAGMVLLGGMALLVPRRNRQTKR